MCFDAALPLDTNQQNNNKKKQKKQKVIINCGALPCLLQLLNSTQKKSIKKEACWTISNITAGTKDQIQAVCDAGLVPPLVYLLQVCFLVCVCWLFGLVVCLLLPPLFL